MVNFVYHATMTLTELRKSKGLTLRDVAARMGKTHPAVLSFEKHGTAPLKTMEAYASALEVPFAAVYEATQETRAVSVA